LGLSKAEMITITSSCTFSGIALDDPREGSHCSKHDLGSVFPRIPSFALIRSHIHYNCVHFICTSGFHMSLLLSPVQASSEYEKGQSAPPPNKGAAIAIQS
jgi:hypothetical protein